MRELKEILKLVEKTDTMILLEADKKDRLTLIMNGFNGDERLFRFINDGDVKNFTMFYGDELRAGSTMNWGSGGTTLASADWLSNRNKVSEVAKSFGFDPFK